MLKSLLPFLLLVTNIAWAENSTCSKCGFKSSSGTAETLVKTSSEIAKGICPIDGEVSGADKPGASEEVGAVEYGIMSASRKMEELVRKASDKAEAFKAMDSGCGEGCSRRNSPDLVLTTVPTKLGKDPDCPATFQTMALKDLEVSTKEPGLKFETNAVSKQINFNGDLEKCQAEASDWAQQVLRGKNDLGNAIESKCQGSCSYSSIIKFMNPSSAKGKCSLGVRIQVSCGPPRLDTEWKTKATLVKNWKCEPGVSK